LYDGVRKSVTATEASKNWNMIDEFALVNLS
jgi:hypothetical protein